MYIHIGGCCKQFIGVQRRNIKPWPRALPMITSFAESALLTTGWADNVRIRVSGGSILSIETGAVAEPGDERHGIVLPGMPNLHSHAFQRGMAGLAETRGPSADSFWTWREIMYRFVERLDPDTFEAIAAMAYAEMRSEERRVGKECRCRGSPDHEKKTKGRR